jgi:hypothetical protein
MLFDVAFLCHVTNHGWINLMTACGDLRGHQHYFAFGFFGAGFFAMRSASALTCSSFVTLGFGVAVGLVAVEGFFATGAFFTTGFGFCSEAHLHVSPHPHFEVDSRVSTLVSKCLGCSFLVGLFLSQLVKKFTCHSLLENEDHARMVLAYSSELVSRRGSVDDCSFSSVPFVVVSFWLLHLLQLQYQTFS